MGCEIKEITFTEIGPLWHKLWPDTPENVKPYNTATFLLNKGYDPSIPYGPVTFLGAFVDEILVGCNSCFKSAATVWMRSRGLYVDPTARKQGIATQLLSATFAQAKKEGCTHLWAYPRTVIVSTYIRCGFSQVGEPITTFDYGPHVWAYGIV